MIMVKSVLVHPFLLSRLPICQFFLSEPESNLLLGRLDTITAVNDISVEETTYLYRAFRDHECLCLTSRLGYRSPLE